MFTCRCGKALQPMPTSESTWHIRFAVFGNADVLQAIHFKPGFVHQSLLFSFVLKVAFLTTIQSRILHKCQTHACVPAVKL